MTSRKPDDLESAPPLSEPDQGGTAPPTLEQLVRWRRDVRRFKSDPVPEALIDRLLRLADLAPSVGNSQPWRIVSVNSPEKRAAIVQNFEAARKRSAEAYSGDQADLYNRLKLAGFDAAPVHLAIFSDRGAMQGHSLGRQTMPETLDHSCACMVTVLWLAAREAGLGLGWVSILDPDCCRGNVGCSGGLEVRRISACRLARGRALGPGTGAPRLAAAHGLRDPLLRVGLSWRNAWAGHGGA